MTVLRECHQLERLQEFVDAHRVAIETYVREALRPVADGLEPGAIQVVCALVDYPIWQSLADRGFQRDEIVNELCRLVLYYAKRRVTKVS